jgi:hypothetical protein
MGASPCTRFGLIGVDETVRPRTFAGRVVERVNFPDFERPPVDPDQTHVWLAVLGADAVQAGRDREPCGLNAMAWMQQ